MRTRTPILVIVALVALSGLAAAQSGQDPNIDDEQGDVDVQHVVDTSALSAFLPEEDVPNEDLETSGDVVAAWIHDETRDTIKITVELANIPNNESFPAPVAEVWTHFVVKQTQYHIEGELASPGEGMPLEPRYQLYENENKAGTLDGGVDRPANTTWVIVPKSKIGSPEPGDRLTQPYITTHVPQEGLDPAASPVLDYAPSAQRVTASEETTPTQVAPVVLGLGPTLSYGSAYTFGDYPGAGEISLEVGPPAMTLTAGDTGQARLTLTNAGTQSETVKLAADAPSDWGIGADTDTLTLPPGATREVQITVTPPAGASGQHLIDIRAASEGGQDTALLSVTVQPPPSSGSQDGGSSGQMTAGDGSSTSLNDDGASGTSPGADGQDGRDAAEGGSGAEEEKGSPSPAGWLVAATVGAVAWAARRRR